MRQILVAALCALLFSFPAGAQALDSAPEGVPSVLDISSGVTSHVQGIAVNLEKGELYFSFTTRFIRTDLKGKVLGTIDRIQGHLGAMTFNPEDGCVYASLECKNDEIGASIAKKLGVPMWEGTYFYVAVIDVAKVDRLEMDPENDPVLRTVFIQPAVEDNEAGVQLPDGVREHRFGCSGIDGVTIGPEPGQSFEGALPPTIPRGSRPTDIASGSVPVSAGRSEERHRSAPNNCLYVAYGVYGDVARTDNDYQVLLCYPLDQIKKYAQTVSFGTMHTSGPSKPWRKFFVRTGNTNYGVQNLAYDPFTGYLLMAVYRGKKEQFPNYSLYAVDLAAKPFKARLEGVPYRTCRQWQLPLAADGLLHESSGIRGWNFRWGSTGLFPLGGGYYLFSENYRGMETGIEGCRTHLMRWTGDPEHPFAPAR